MGVKSSAALCPRQKQPRPPGPWHSSSSSSAHQPELPTAPDLYPSTNHTQGFGQSPGHFMHYLEDLPTPIWPRTLGMWYWPHTFFQGIPNAYKINLEYLHTVFTVQVLDFTCTTCRETWHIWTKSPDCSLGILGCLCLFSGFCQLSETPRIVVFLQCLTVSCNSTKKSILNLIKYCPINENFTSPSSLYHRHEEVNLPSQ